MADNVYHQPPFFKQNDLVISLVDTSDVKIGDRGLITRIEQTTLYIRWLLINVEQEIRLKNLPCTPLVLPCRLLGQEVVQNVATLPANNSYHSEYELLTISKSAETNLYLDRVPDEDSFILLTKILSFNPMRVEDFKLLIDLCYPLWVPKGVEKCPWVLKAGGSSPFNIGKELYLSENTPYAAWWLDMLISILFKPRGLKLDGHIQWKRETLFVASNGLYLLSNKEMCGTVLDALKRRRVE